MVLIKVGENEVTSEFSGDVDVNIGGDVSSSDTVTLSASNTQNISSDTTISLSDSGSINKTVSASATKQESLEFSNESVSYNTAIYTYQKSFQFSRTVITSSTDTNGFSLSLYDGGGSSIFGGGGVEIARIGSFSYPASVPLDPFPSDFPNYGQFDDAQTGLIVDQDCTIDIYGQQFVGEATIS